MDLSTIGKVSLVASAADVVKSAFEDKDVKDFEKYLNENFYKMDKNKDYKLTREEIAEALKADVDKKSPISLDQLESMFTKLDLDKNNCISLREVLPDHKLSNAIRSAVGEVGSSSNLNVVGQNMAKKVCQAYNLTDDATKFVATAISSLK